MMSRLLPHPLVSCVFAVSFVLFFWVSQPILSDPDSAWHIATGEWILAHGFTYEDPWSFYGPEQTWVNFSWVWQIGLGLIKATFGETGLAFTAYFLNATILALATHLLLQRKTIREEFVAVTVFLIGFTLYYFHALRPQSGTLLLSLITHHLLYRSRGDARSRAVYLVPALMLLWANIHAGFIVGFSLIAVYMIEAWFTKDRVWLHTLIRSGTLSLLATFINPYGWNLHLMVIRSFSDPITPYLMEWMPFRFGAQEGISALVFFFMLSSHLLTKEVRLSDKLIAVIWFAGALYSIRNFSVFAVVAAPYMATNLMRLSEALRAALNETRDVGMKDSPALRTRFGIAAVILPATVIALQFSLPLRDELFHDDTQTGRDAVAYIEEHYPNDIFYNEYNIGQTIIYYTHGRRKVFSDPRSNTVYTNARLKENMTFGFMEEGWVEIPKHYGAKGIIVRDVHPLYDAFDELMAQKTGLKEVYRGKGALVLVYR
jgi:hypothetical protein